jgi:hypothetical protein
MDNKTRIFALNEYELSEITSIETRTAVSAVAYSPLVSKCIHL